MTNETAGNPASLVNPDAFGQPGRPAADDPQPAMQGRKFIVFVVGGSSYAVDSRAVSEVVRDLVPAKIPNTPEWLLGIANLRSEIVTVVDLKGLLSDGAGVPAQNPKHIVVRLEMMDALIALRVEKLREVVTIEKTGIVPTQDPGLSFVSGTFKRDGETFTVLNIGKVVESLKLG